MTTPTVPVTVTLAAQDGTPYQGITVRARLDINEVYQGFVISDQIEAVTDADGVAVLNCFPNAPDPTGLGTQGSTYSFRAAIPGGRSLAVEALVPNVACRLENILVSEQPVSVDGATLALLQAQAAVTTVTASQSAAAESAEDAAASATVAAASKTAAETAETNAEAAAATAISQAAEATTRAAQAGASAMAADDSRVAVEAAASLLVSVTESRFAGGAKGDGVADDTAAIQAALNYVNTRGGGVVHLPPGRYRKADTGATLVMYANTTIRGAGDSSVVFFDDRDTNPRSDLLAVNTGAANVAFESFKIEGTALTYTNQTNQSQALTGSGIDGLRIHGVTFEKLRFMATAFNNCKRVQAIGNRMDYIVRDGLRFTNSDDVVIAYNVLRRVADDAIALHSLDASTVPSGAYVVIGNVLEQCQGIKVLGAKQATIKDNVIRRSIRAPIYVAIPDTGSEGNTPVFSVDITGNTITDTLGTRGTNYSILVKSAQRDKLALTQQPGVSTIPYAYNYVQNIDGGAVVNVGAWGVRICGNTIARTLPPAGAFTNYGYGQLFDANTAGFLSDPAITDADFEGHALNIQAPINGLLIDGNMISGVGTSSFAINLDAPTAGNLTDYSNTQITNNIFVDVPNLCIVSNAAGSGAGSKRLVIRGNTFDLDPYFRNATHNADNTWSATTSGIAVYNRSAPEIVLESNWFSHCSLTINSLTNNVHAAQNYVLCDPTAHGSNAANKGVRRIDDAAGFEFVIYDADPSSASFGRITTMPLSAASSIPTSGKYVFGKVVRARGMAVAGTAGAQYIVTGWKRITTGAGHVLNTDWVELRCLTGT